MEKQPSYVLMPSLKEMALRRIAVILMNRPDFLDMTRHHPYQSYGERYRRMWWDENGVNYKIEKEALKLQLPKALTVQMIPILKAVGTELQKWKLLHSKFLKDTSGDIGVPVLKKLCWTSAGTVDYQKTADAIIHSDVVDILKRFELTCLYCLEDYIPVIWKELFKKSKGFICRGEVKPLQFFFPYIIEKQSMYCISGRVAPSVFFKYSALSGNKTAAQYCYEKLSKEEREASLFPTAVEVVRERNRRFTSTPFYEEFKPTQEKLSDVLSYLLSLMTPEEQMRIFRELPCEVLRCFLDWPWQDLFLDIADVIWTFLPESKYDELWLIIGSYVHNSGNYIPNFLQKLFLGSPRSFRKSFVNLEYNSVRFFWEIFRAETVKDYQTVKVIFRNIDAADRKTIFFSSGFNNLLNFLVMSNRWGDVELCIREASLSKEDRGRLGRISSEFKTKYATQAEFKHKIAKWNRLLDFLDEMDACPADKRGPEDVSPATVKKSCFR